MNVVCNIVLQPLDLGLGHGARFGQWDVSRCDEGKGFSGAELELFCLCRPHEEKMPWLMLVSEE